MRNVSRYMSKPLGLDIGNSLLPNRRRMRKRVTQRSQIANCAFRMLSIERDLPLGPTKSHT
jgi:hypothetical protein